LNGTTNGSGEARLRSDFSSGAWQGAISVSAPGEKPVETTIDIGVP
jgi:hypothetical protein